ncbi:arabinosyltransferase domain-containing protein [Gordonia polyisoprenivorans]|uniref:arabinosyltransferase domain-containing protein n=1 Tax=Gordonia polyisoprenivorans TaxID=84595 RepID=UPI0023009301|nr:arabinosyltransferase domain-containing protein [Gordonia polyisoprenivorans]WCB37878.1 arabinosyltransferase domain-containing protein [Gordonia polyisoprenivorans]
MTETSTTPAPTDATGRSRRIRIARIVAVVAGLIGIVLALAMAVLPVTYTKVQIKWPQPTSQNASGVENILAPNVSYTPTNLDLSVPCRLAADLPARGGVLVSTVPENGAEAGKVGLFVRATTDRLLVAQRNAVLLNVPRAQAQSTPDCTIVIHADTSGIRGEIQGFSAADGASTSFRLDDPNARPQIIGVYTDLPSTVDTTGLSYSSTVDTRFVSSPTTLKLAAALVGIVMAIASMIALAVLDTQDGRRRRRLLPGRMKRPRGDDEDEDAPALPPGRKPWWHVSVLDALVVAVLIIWLFVGGNTADDGYQVTVGRIAPGAGYLDNYYRYFGVPQDPFGWHYQYLALWMQVSTATPWLRLLPLIFGVLCWFMLSRGAFGRIGSAVRNSRAARWAGAFAFLAVWLAFNNGLRVEPFLAVGILATWLLVERSVATGRLFPLTLAIVVAAFTLTVHPAGAIAAVALIAALRPIFVRLRVRIRRDGWFPTLTPILASGLLVLYEIFADQPLASILEGVKVQGIVGPTNKWWTEAMRYYILQNPTTDGSIARRVGIFMTLFAVILIVLVLLSRRRVPGIATAPLWRIVAILAGAVGVLAFSPTKATHQYGAFATLTGVLVAAATAFISPQVIRRRCNRTFIAAAATYVLAVVFTGRNQWWYVGSYGIPWGDDTPNVAGIKLYQPILLIAVIITLVGAWQYFRDDRRAQLGGPIVEPTSGVRGFLGRMPTYSLAIVLAVVLVFNMISFAKAVQTQRGSWSWASSNVNALRGNPCALADAILVEADPNKGLLSPARVAGQENSSPGAALAGKDMVGFTPNGVATDLQTTYDDDNDADSDLQDPTQTDPNAATDTGENSIGTADTAGGTTATKGINGSSVKLPFGLDPAKVPVLGSYGAPGSRASLTSEWYQLPKRSPDAPLVTMSVAGTVGYIDDLAVTHPGPELRLEFGRVEPDGSVTTVASQVPLGIATDPAWRNMRFPLDKAPPRASVVRVVAADTSSDPSGWLAVTPPRVTPMVTLNDLVGSKDPTLLDWEVALAFPCQRPAEVHNGIWEIPKWRITPDADGERVNSRNWMAGNYGGPLGMVDNDLSATVLPSYLRNSWAKDWGSLQRLTPLVDQTPADLVVTQDTHTGLWTPGPMRAIMN